VKRHQCGYSRAIPRELDTYLKDHYAGSAGGTGLCRRIAEGASGDAEQREVNDIAEAIEADQATLEEIMSRIGVSPSRFKAVGAWIGEKGSRLKLRSSSEAGRVFQYEAMIMGVTGKLQLWHSLLEIGPQVPEFRQPELEELKGRAADQQARLQKLHDTAAGNLSADR